MISPVPLLLASTNVKKRKELEFMLSDLPVKVHVLSEYQVREVEETGKSFKDNAILKACGYAEQTGLLTLGEDSGLCCDALEGAPGIYSARFAGTGKDADNNAKLLKLLENVPDNCRGAHYVSAVALAEPGKLIGTVEGTVHGYISKELRGTGGFGYDPLFFYPAFGKTFGEVEAEMKHRVSHRFKALEKAKLVLERYLQELQKR